MRRLGRDPLILWRERQCALRIFVSAKRAGNWYQPVAEQAVGIILAFLIKEAPADKIKPLIDAMPGAAEAAAAAPSGGVFNMGGAAVTNYVSILERAK